MLFQFLPCGQFYAIAGKYKGPAPTVEEIDKALYKGSKIRTYLERQIKGVRITIIEYKIIETGICNMTYATHSAKLYVKYKQRLKHEVEPKTIERHINVNFRNVGGKWKTSGF